MKDKLQQIGEEIFHRMKKILKKFRKRWKVKMGRFCAWKPWNWIALVLVLVVIIAFSATKGYSAGKKHELKRAEQKERMLTAQHKKEIKKLQKELKEAQLENPEKRPWNLILVNDSHPMEKGYVPELAKLSGNYKVDKRILKPLKKMLRAAEKDGMDMYVCSAYRTVNKQKQLYNRRMGEEIRAGKSYWQAFEATRMGTALPGTSEHGLGIAVDIISNSYTKLDEKQKDTPEAKWLEKNCYKYGFILRYPVDKTEITGIMYEPWHYRYVGVEDATKIMKTGVTLEEYLGEVD